MPWPQTSSVQVRQSSFRIHLILIGFVIALAASRMAAKALPPQVR